MEKYIAATGLALAGAFAFAHFFFNVKRYVKKKDADNEIAPRAVPDHGQLKIESFGDYVVRQLRLVDSAIAKTVSKAAESYLRNGDRETTDIACMLVSGQTEMENAKEICEEMLKELEICVVAYFSFHWKHAASVIDQVISAGATQKRFHRAVLSALRKQRYDKVLKTLSTKRKIYTLVDELKRIRKPDASVPDEGRVTVPAESSKRSPVILFIGGGMGAGKSTVVKEILASSFWGGVIHDAVVVEADALKETDVIYRALSSFHLGDVAGDAQLVHQYSTEAANSLLVSALNKGLDVVFDGTMSWEPFVLQTMDMVRDIHKRRYRMGPGYKRNADGTVIEEYWKPLADDDDDEWAATESTNGGDEKNHIEFSLRGIVTKRGVPVKGQLRSHKMFANSIEKYMSVADSARIYSTNKWLGPAELIAMKEGPNKKVLVDVDTYPGVRYLAQLNTDSGSVTELYNEDTGGTHVNQYWRNVILNQERKTRQARLREAILANTATSELLERSTSQLINDETTIKALIGEFLARKNKTISLAANRAPRSVAPSSDASSSG